MSGRRVLALLLALLVLVTSSRAATMCVESDGNARLEFVGAIPRNPAGKIQKNVLREQFAS